MLLGLHSRNHITDGREIAAWDSEWSSGSALLTDILIVELPPLRHPVAHQVETIAVHTRPIALARVACLAAHLPVQTQTLHLLNCTR